MAPAQPHASPFVLQRVDERNGPRSGQHRRPLAKLSATGSICIYTLAASDLVVDVNGYVPAGSSVSSLTPDRLADSRPGNPTADGDDQAFGPVAAGAFKEIQVTGRGDVPADATLSCSTWPPCAPPPTLAASDLVVDVNGYTT